MADPPQSQSVQQGLLAIWRTGRGLHYLMTSGTRADSDQTDFVSDSLEVVFGATTSDYLDFLDDVLAISPLFPQAGYVSLRPSLSSKASLSMHNIGSARAISIELATIKPLLGNGPWLAYCHHAAVRRNGRPHWGQTTRCSRSTPPCSMATSSTSGVKGCSRCSGS